ncbi:MAG: hypothetical protein Fur006_40710 [Coleofasciculaceae cyanobacterium]
MFERYTDKALKVIMLALEEARRLGHNFVGTEQILLGLIAEGTGVAAKVLKSVGVNLKDARIEVETIIGRGSSSVAVEIPFTPRAKRALELSLKEARQLGHNYVGTEHLLLGLIREGEGVAARVLEKLDVDLSQVRTKVIRVVGETAEVADKILGQTAKVADEEKFDPMLDNQQESDSIIQIEGSSTDNNQASRHTRAIEVVCSYSQSNRDEDLLDNLAKHLSSLKREGVITYWDQREISAGEEWQSKIDNHLDTASIILLLISADFIDSDECYYQEFERAIKRYENAEAYIVPVLLRAVDWKERRFGDMPVLPRNGIPVTSWTNIDEAFQDVAKGIRELVQEIWLRDEQGVNEAYNQLKKELAAKEWRKADEATKTIVFKVCGREQAGNLTAEDIKNFPFQDIYAIDKLWLKHSNGRFGFSTQNRILQLNDYEDFIQQVGWRVDDSWLEYENLDLTLSAPLGHLPYCGVHFWKAVPSVPPESPTIPYYRLNNNFYYRYPPYNLYYQQRERQRQLSEKLKRQSKFNQLLDYPSFNSQSINNRSGGGVGGGLVALGWLARTALPLAVGAAVVGGLAWVGWEVYKNYRDESERQEEERERQEEENEIKEKIDALLSRLD